MSHPTLPQNPSASPDRGVDRLFAALLTMYGKHWLDLWADCDVDAVKASWASALHGVDGEAIRLALDAIQTAGKPFPPTQPEFVSLCRQFTRRGPHRLALVDNTRDDGPRAGFSSLREIMRKAAPK
jgi:hypothetical protein